MYTCMYVCMYTYIYIYVLAPCARLCRTPCTPVDGGDYAYRAAGNNGPG